jgi:hypothetical protein
VTIQEASIFLQIDEFETKDEAAAAYDCASVKFYGEFSRVMSAKQ